MDILHHIAWCIIKNSTATTWFDSMLILFQFLKLICADDAKHNKQPRRRVSQAVHNTSDWKLNWTLVMVHYHNIDTYRHAVWMSTGWHNLITFRQQAIICFSLWKLTSKTWLVHDTNESHYFVLANWYHQITISYKEVDAIKSLHCTCKLKPSTFFKMFRVSPRVVQSTVS